jgi:hypothetical protein
MELGCRTHLVVFIPWPPPPAVDGSTHVRVDLEPPITVVCSGPAMAAGARRGAIRVEEPPPGMDLRR